MCTHEACKGGCNGVAGVPQKGDDGVACACARGGSSSGGITANTALH